MQGTAYELVRLPCSGRMVQMLAFQLLSLETRRQGWEIF